MGRFASTASLYEHLRPPYPREFFRTVAHKLALTRKNSLIDLDTGPGLLALGVGATVWAPASHAISTEAAQARR